jgi:ectoine hydroxylase-related dioxygenase (phytanoyl-CoA dioxygenase family)
MSTNTSLQILSVEQVRQFYEDGFTIARNVFTKVELDEIRTAFDRLYELGLTMEEPQNYKGSRFDVVTVKEGVLAGSRTVKLIMWCGANEPALSEYGRDPRLLKMAGQLLGSTQMQQLINQAHFKYPGTQVKFDWHQDIQFRQDTNQWQDLNGRGSYVQTLISVDETTVENGPTVFIPGNLKNLKLNEGYDETNPPFNVATAVAPTLNAGDVVLFGPYTVHSSLPNLSKIPRRVFINGFAYPGASQKTYIAGGTGRVVGF